MNLPQGFELDNTQLDPLPVKQHSSPPHQQIAPRGVINAMLDSLPQAEVKAEYSFQPVVPTEPSVLVAREASHPQQDCWQCVQCGNYNLGRTSICFACQTGNGGTRESLVKRNDDDTDWECKCGNLVGAKKTRCGSCQRWRGGKQSGRAGRGHHLSLTNVPFVREDWMCDSCGHLNAHNKVRCVGCPRWRDGKRPNIKLSVSGQASDLAIEATLTDVAAQGNWICHGCEAVNLGQKARCRICQSWKGGRRQNMPTRCTPDPNCDSQEPWTCDGCGHTNGGAKLRCGSCQHWKDGRRLNMRAKHHNDFSTAPSTIIQQKNFHHLSNTPWQCAKCGQNNEATKLRCRNCKSWKNSKHKQLSGARASFSAPPLESLAPEAVTPWVCNECNHFNAVNNTRCDSCQCWQDHEKIHHSHIKNEDSHPNPHEQQANQVDHSAVGLSVDAPGALPAHYYAQSPEVHNWQDAQQQLPWVCPRCSRENLGSKARCGGCQKWKGGIRQNYKSKKWKVVTDPWICHRCNLQNAANKVRCKACQCWKDGGRPDVLARKELAKQLRSKVGDWWPCDKCNHRNKPKNQRCGGCQRWRGGSRPQMRKKPTSEETKPAQPMPHFPLPIKMPNQSPQSKVPLIPYPPNQRDVNEYPPSSECSWTCDKCAFVNLATETTCTICEEPKPGKETH